MQNKIKGDFDNNLKAILKILSPAWNSISSSSTQKTKNKKQKQKLDECEEGRSDWRALDKQAAIIFEKNLTPA